MTNVLFAAALELILGSDERIEVVGTAFDGKQAVELALELGPDVVLMDLSMPRSDGFVAIEAILGSVAAAGARAHRVRRPGRHRARAHRRRLRVPDEGADRRRSRQRDPRSGDA